MDTKIRLGVSSCLLGNMVRYDGGHQHDRFLTDTLGRYVEFIPVCPEVECGLPVPREAMRLVGSPDSPRLVTVKTNHDHTEKMQTWAMGRLSSLAGENLDGFVFKRKSPSSGMARVKVYSEAGMPNSSGIGIFAKAFMARFPHLPVEEDGRLHDPTLRENFIQRIFAHRRWRVLQSSAQSRGGLVQFHTAHKLLLLSHSEEDYRILGRLVAAAKEYSVEELYTRYEAQFMNALKKKSTIKKHTNVLGHIFGYFKKNLSTLEKKEVLAILEQYRQGAIPLIVPVTLMKFFVKKYQQQYLAGQCYLNPHPLQLKLLNHA